MWNFFFSNFKLEHWKLHDFLKYYLLISSPKGELLNKNKEGQDSEKISRAYLLKQAQKAAFQSADYLMTDIICLL
jgi:hypothetical protein